MSWLRHDVTRLEFNQHLSHLFALHGEKLRVRVGGNKARLAREEPECKVWSETKDFFLEGHPEDILMSCATYDEPDLNLYYIHEQGPSMAYPWRAEDFEMNCFQAGDPVDQEVLKAQMAKHPLVQICDAECYLMAWAPDYLAPAIVELLNLGMQAKEDLRRKENWECIEAEAKAQRRADGCICPADGSGATEPCPVHPGAYL